MTGSRTRVTQCPHCFRTTTSLLRSNAAWIEDLDAGSDTRMEFSLFQCLACRLPILWQVSGLAEDDMEHIVYPEPYHLDASIPANLRQECEKVRTCLTSGEFTAAVVMVRRVLEGICMDHGIEEPNLARALATLRSTGRIDEMLSGWAEVLRMLGNQGAHYGKALVTRQDAEDGLEFAETLLEYIYVLRRRFDRFTVRRNAIDT